MSGLQSKTKQHLVPLIVDDWSHIATAGRSVLGAWAVMFTVVLEFSDLQTLSTTPEQRRFLMEKRQPPPNWYVWLGRYQGDLWNKAFNHFGLDGIAKVRRCPGEETAILAAEVRSQSAALLLGNLFLMTFSTRMPGGSELARKHAAEYGLCTVWPVEPIRMAKPERVLGDYEADDVSRAFVPQEMRGVVRRAWETT